MDTPTIDSAVNADELLTALANVPPHEREFALMGRGVTILRVAADLCGVGDTDNMSKGRAIDAILANF
jgi:hypothetical protein